VGIVLLFALVALIVWLNSRERPSPQRDQDLYHHWHAMHEMCRTTPGAAVVQVSNAYQRAQRGTKAIVVWTATGYQQDAWFAGSHPMPGSFLLVRGRIGWGPHNGNPEVLYVEPHEVLYRLPPDTGRAYERHHRRVMAGLVR